jgi:hypothetical protein
MLLEQFPSKVHVEQIIDNILLFSALPHFGTGLKNYLI